MISNQKLYLCYKYRIIYRIMGTATLDTSAELFRQIGILADDDSSMKKLLTYAKKLVVKKAMTTAEESVMTKEEILSDFAEACHELKLRKEGKKSFKTWEEFQHELQEEGYCD